MKYKTQLTIPAQVKRLSAKNAVLLIETLYHFGVKCKHETVWMGRSQ